MVNAAGKISFPQTGKIFAAWGKSELSDLSEKLFKSGFINILIDFEVFARQINKKSGKKTDIPIREIGEFICDHRASLIAKAGRGESSNYGAFYGFRLAVLMFEYIKYLSKDLNSITYSIFRKSKDDQGGLDDDAVVIRKLSKKMCEINDLLDKKILPDPSCSCKTTKAKECKCPKLGLEERLTLKQRVVLQNVRDAIWLAQVEFDKYDTPNRKHTLTSTISEIITIVGLLETKLLLGAIHSDLKNSHIGVISNKKAIEYVAKADNEFLREVKFIKKGDREKLYDAFKKERGLGKLKKNKLQKRSK